MLDRIIAWSLRNRLVVLVGAVALLTGGVYSALTTPVDVFPDLTAPTVTVLTEAHGMAAQEVETLVTFPLETAVNGAAGVRRVRSSSAQGISIVWVEFDWGTDIFRDRQIVSEKLQLVGAQLPEGAGPPVLAPITSIMGEIMLIGMTSDRHDPMELRAMADWTIRKRLLAVPGVAQVVPIGGAVKEYQVRVNPERLRAYRVSLHQVLEAARGSNAVASGGVYLDSGREILIRGLGRARAADEIAATVITTRDGAPLLIEDVADVRIGPKPRIGTASVNAEPAVILSIQKQPNANTLELTERIEAELDRLELRRLANQVRATIEDVPGLVDLAVEQQADVPQLQIRADRRAMAKFGVTPGALIEAVDVGFAGEEVSRILEGQQAFDLVVRFDEESRGSEERVENALIDTGIGAKVALSQVADVRTDHGPNTISRENVQRKIVVQANVEGRDVVSAVNEIQERIAAGIALPTDYFIEYGGQFESGRAAARAITLLSLLSVLAIFLLLFEEFGSARTAFLLMVNLPLALAGGIFAVVIAAHGVINVATMVGFITLFGIAVRNGILLVSRYQSLAAEGRDVRESIFEGSMERLSPILMTALTAGLALIPLALGGGEPGKEIQTPMAIVVLGGLLTSTALNMIVVPALYLRFGRLGAAKGEDLG